MADQVVRFVRATLCALTFGILHVAVFAQTGGADKKQNPTPPPKVSTQDVRIPSQLVLTAPTQIELGSQPLSLDEAIAFALRKQPSVNIAKANLLSAQGQTQQANANLLPQFVANAGYNDQRSILNGSGPVSNPASASIGIQQLIFDFGRTRDLVRQELALERGVRFQLTRTQQKVVLQVKLAFYNLIQSRSNVATSESDLSNRKRQLDQAQARMESGLGAPVDVIQAKTNLADAAISLESARESVLLDQLNLAQLLGIDPRTPITPSPTSERELSDESELPKLVASALEKRPDIKAAREQVRAASFALEVAKKTNYPQINASAGINGNGASDPFANQSGVFGINVVWTFGDGGLTSGRLKSARGGEEVSKQNLFDTTNQAVNEVSQYYVSLQSALQRVTLAKVEVENAVELVRISEGRYIGGLGQFLDVTTAQNSLFNSNQRLTQAQEDVERARAQLRTALGMD